MAHAARFVGYPLAFLALVVFLVWLEDLAEPLRQVILAHAWSRYTLATVNVGGLLWFIWMATE